MLFFRITTPFALLLIGPPAVFAQPADEPAPQQETSSAQAAASGELPPDPAPAPIEVKGKGEKKVCRTEVVTGSIMPKRVCRTEAEIEADNAAAAQALQTMQRDRDAARHLRDLREAGN